MVDQRNEPARFVKLATIGDVATAHVLKARLEAEGIEVRIHGFSLGPYPMLIGELAETELWVLNDRVDVASEIMLDSEVNDALHPVEHPPVRRADPLKTLTWRLLAVAVAVAFVFVWLNRLLRVVGLY